MANAFRFMREVKQEGLKVTWSDRQQVVRFTIVVMVIALVMSMIMFFADWAIATAIEFLLKK